VRWLLARSFLSVHAGRFGEGVDLAEEARGGLGGQLQQEGGQGEGGANKELWTKYYRRVRGLQRSSSCRVMDEWYPCPFKTSVAPADCHVA
jgi:hypothetical protein